MEGAMGYLKGLKEYLAEGYNISIFDQVRKSKKTWEFCIHGHRIVRAKIIKDHPYDLRLAIEGQGKETFHKTQVKWIYPAEQADAVRPLIKTDQKVEKLALEPILSPGQRFFVKNKSIFPLMKERQVVFFTLLEGEVIRGVIADFSRYDITVNLKGGIPVTIFRHSIYDLRDKKKRCYLKSSQETSMDWKKSELFVTK
jgi:hypothetical protein